MIAPLEAPAPAAATRGFLAPAPRLFGLVLALFGAAAAAAFFNVGSLYPAAMAAVSLVAVYDAWRAPRTADVGLGVVAPGEWLVGAANEVRLFVDAGARASGATCEAALLTDARFRPAEVGRAELSDAGAAAFGFPIRAVRRGPPEALGAAVRVESPWRLWRRRVIADLPPLRAVAPDIGPVREAAKRASVRSGVMQGLRPRLTPGEGSNFDALRDFAPGHDRRALHWKASARHRRLLVRDFRAESSRQVVFVFDCGRLMAEPLDGLARLDHASRAALRLAYDAERAGDLAGVFDFADKPGSFRAPAPGKASFRATRSAVAALETRPVETNFTLGLSALAAGLKRRTLVVVFTEFADPTTAELMIDHLGSLARRHLVLFVALRDRTLDAIAERSPADERQVAESGIAYELIRERRDVLARLRRLGVQVLDVAPEAATAELLERWVELKRRERL